MASTRCALLGAVTLFLLAQTSALRAGENTDNPKYKAWSSFKVGSSATLTSTTQAGQMAITMEMTNTLVEVNDQHVVIETSMTMTVNGQVQKIPAHKSTIEAKAEKLDWKDQGTEQIKAAEKTLICKVVEGSMPMAGGAASTNAGAGNKAKLWMSEEVPGGLVQMKATLGMGPVKEVTYLLKKFEAK